MGHLVIQQLAKELTREDLDCFNVPLNWPVIRIAETLTQLHVTDGVGFFWEFCLLVQWDLLPSKAYLLPDGWLPFVNYKDLKVGDRIVLDEKENRFRGTKFRIRAQKRDSQGNWIDV